MSRVEPGDRIPDYFLSFRGSDTILIRFTDTTGVFFISGDTVLIRFRDGVEYDLI